MFILPGELSNYFAKFEGGDLLPCVWDHIECIE